MCGDSICDNCGELYWNCECEDAAEGDFDLDEGTPAPGSYDGWQDDWKHA